LKAVFQIVAKVLGVNMSINFYDIYSKKIVKLREQYTFTVWRELQNVI